MFGAFQSLPRLFLRFACLRIFPHFANCSGVSTFHPSLHPACIFQLNCGVLLSLTLHLPNIAHSSWFHGAQFELPLAGSACKLKADEWLLHASGSGLSRKVCPDVWHRFEKTLHEKFLPNAGWDLFEPSARRGGSFDLGCAPVSPLFRRAGGGRRDVSGSVDSPFPLAAPRFSTMPRVHLSRPLPSSLPSLSYFPSRPLGLVVY